MKKSHLVWGSKKNVHLYAKGESMEKEKRCSASSVSEERITFPFKKKGARYAYVVVRKDKGKKNLLQFPIAEEEFAVFLKGKGGAGQDFEARERE